MESTINLNQSACLKGVEHFGYTTYHNLCSGVVTAVPWGIDNWMALGVLTTLVALIVVGIGILLYQSR